MSGKDTHALWNCQYGKGLYGYCPAWGRGISHLPVPVEPGDVKMGGLGILNRVHSISNVRHHSICIPEEE